MVECPHPSLRKTPAGYACSACGQPVAMAGGMAGGIAGGALPASAGTSAPPPTTTRPTPWAEHRLFGVPRGGLVVGAATLPLAGLITAVVPFFCFITGMLSTLCHEMGHAAAALVTGRPALPAFDFAYGGGVTMAGERRWWLLALYAVAVVTVWRQSAARPRLRRLLEVATAAVVLLLVTGLDEAWFVAMGHGGELLAAGIFLYRAFTGVAEIQPGERWLYGVMGWCLLGHALSLDWRLLFDPEFQDLYLLGKRGVDNDLVRLANDVLGTGLGTVAWLALLVGLLVPPLALLAAARWPRER